MKFYLHSEDNDFTMVIQCSEDYYGTIEDITSIFIEKLRQKLPSALPGPDHVDFVVKKGQKVLEPKEDLKSKVKDRDDLYVTFITPPAHGARPKTDSKKAVKTKGNKKADENKVSSDKEPVSIPPLSKETRKVSSEVDGLTKSVVEFAEKGYFQQAAMTLEEIIRIDPRNVEAHIGLVDIYLKADRPQKALKWIKKAGKFHNGSDLCIREAQCYLNLTKSDKAIQLLLDYCKDMRKLDGETSASKHDVQVMLARAYLQKDQKDMAITVLQGVLRENGQHPDALAEYAPLIFPFAQPNQKEDTMSVVLTLLASNKGSMVMKEKFASMCKEEHGLNVLKSVAGAAWNDVSALVFMATSLRDCGAIKEALKILEHAYNIGPGNSQTVLTFVHTMELVEQHTEAVALIKKFVNSFPDQKVGSFTCRMVQPVIQSLTGNVYFHAASDLSDLDLPQVDLVTEEYPDDQRYTLALMFTLVKILYIKGALGYIKPLTKLLDPCSEGHSLHQTNIRNEYAYYTCICKVLEERKEFPPLNKDNPYIYFVGDSHCVPPGWQQISYQGKKVTIHPVLSTGTKIWHLREKSTFYPKTNFHSGIGVIPDNSTVMFCFGEIDCREALMYCVEQARYDSLEEAIDAVIDIYLNLLLSLQKQKHWNIHVHPVMPVLEPTRPVVMQFNKQLARRVNNTKKLHWLHFVDKLLVEDDTNLRPEFDFDGTHCHPAYVSLLEKALADNTPGEDS